MLIHVCNLMSGLAQSLIYVLWGTLFCGSSTCIQCSTCLKSIRSDNMKFHIHSKDVKYKMKICPTCKTSMKAGNLSRHMRKHDKQLHLDLIEELERGKEKKKKDYER